MSNWNELFRHAEHRWRQPHESVVELTGRLRDRKNRRVLDLGCGAGRHLVYLSKQGFEACGTDISEVGIQHARQWLEEEGLRADIRSSDMTCIPYPDGHFGGVISIHVVFHNTLENLRRSIAEIFRVLEPGGLAFITFQSKRSYRYGRGEKVEADTFIADLGSDAGVPHHYSDLAEFDRELAAFIIRKIELYEHPVEPEGTGVSSHWSVLVEKPGFPQ